MSERKIPIRNFIEDVRSGLNNAALMKKYRLNAEGLRNVFVELTLAGLLEPVGSKYVVPSTRRLSARKMAADIRGGMNGSQLMERYILTSDQLAAAVEALIRNKVMTKAEIGPDLGALVAPKGPENLREMDRCYLDFELPIVDTGPPEIDGVVRDLTEKGVGIVGIPSEVGETKTFLVLHDEFVLIEPFMFDAECRWTTRNDPGGEFVSGFQITRIADKDLAELRKLLHLVTFYA